MIPALLLAISAAALYFSLVQLSPKNASIPKIGAFLAAQFTVVNLIHSYISYHHNYVGFLIQFACAAALLHIILDTDTKVSGLVAAIYVAVKVGAGMAVSFLARHF